MDQAPVQRTEAFRNTIPLVPWAVLWLLAPVAALDLIFADVLTRNWGHVLGRDFSNLWTAGRLVLEGNSSCVFDLGCFRIKQFDSLGLLANQNYSYPPHALFLAVPFAIPSYPVALALWTIAGILFLTWSSRSFLPKGFPPLLVAFTTAGWLNIWNGHYGFFLAGLWLLCFRFIKTRPRMAGVMAGLLTFKPHLGVMIAATVAQRRKALLAALITTALAFAVSAAVFGLGTWLSFFEQTTGAQAHILARMTPQVYFRMMPSPYVAFGRGIPGIAAQVAFVGCTLWLLWRRGKMDAFSAATATFLIVPYSFNYDMTVVCLGVAILLYQHWNRLLRYERIALVIAFLSPQLTFFLPPLVPLSLLAALSIQLKLPPVGPRLGLGFAEWRDNKNEKASVVKGEIESLQVA